MGIKNDLQKKNLIHYLWKKHLVNPTFIKIQSKMLLIPFITYTYYDYWNLINKFWAGSTKWNTPFSHITLVNPYNSILESINNNIEIDRNWKYGKK